MPRDPAARWAKTVALVVLPVFLLAGFAAATYTPLFRLRDIRVEGTSSLRPREVIARAGIGSGTNVFHLDAGSIVTALEADPWIRSATVERHLPGSVVITVQERTPIAQALVGTNATVVAGDGIVLPGAAVAGLPEIRASVGELTNDDRTAAAEALDAMPAVVRARVSAVVAEPTGALVMDLTGGLTVRYGGAGEQLSKATALRSVLAWATREHVALAEIDLSVPEAPSATLQSGETITPST
jgi:cell division protein FtsQ